jgi:hypothetical protein
MRGQVLGAQAVGGDGATKERSSITLDRRPRQTGIFNLRTASQIDPHRVAELMPAAACDPRIIRKTCS